MSAERPTTLYAWLMTIHQWLSEPIAAWATPEALAILSALMALVSAAWTIYRFMVIRRQVGKTEESLEEQLNAALRALQAHSRRATQLLGRLQQEVTDRNAAMQGIETQLQELRHQRALLGLTDEQRQAIERLLRRRPSAKDIFTSLDFWLGRVVPGAFFFTMGLLASWLVRR